MPAHLRVTIHGAEPAILEALAAGDFTVVADGAADLHLEVVAAGDGTGSAHGHPDGDGHPDGGVAVVATSTDAMDATDGAGAAGRAGRRTSGYRPDQPGGALTRRERQVLAHLGRGASNRQIAQSLYIADNTVKNHVRSILQKLDCRSRTEAVVTAHRIGLLEL